MHHSKSGKARTVPLDSEGAAFFEELSAGKDAGGALPPSRFSMCMAARSNEKKRLNELAD